MTATTVCMVPPVHFGFNPQTAMTNGYQKKIIEKGIREKAMSEYSAMVHALEDHRVQVLSLPQDKPLPDAVFPNNWFSTHLDDKGETHLVLYPMHTPNRQAEVDPELLVNTLKAHDIQVTSITDLRKNSVGTLEGTGSIVKDRKNKRLYASLSLRTHPLMVNRLAETLGYEAVIFHGVDQNKQAIYHSNVMMSIAGEYAIICLDSIVDAREAKQVRESLEHSGKTLIPISHMQVNHMCANALELISQQGERLLVMSRQAYDHFTASQRSQLEQFASIVPVSLDTIEAIGGGSARCMMAEIFHGSKSSKSSI